MKGQHLTEAICRNPKSRERAVLAEGITPEYPTHHTLLWLGLGLGIRARD